VSAWQLYDLRRDYERQQDQILEAQVETARALASALEAVLNNLRSSLALVAHQLERDRPSPAEAAAHLASVHSLVWPADSLVLVDDQGVVRAAVPEEPLGDSLLDEPHVRAVLRDGRPWAMSPLVAGRGSGRLEVGMALAVRDGGGRAAGAIIGFVPARTFGDTLGPPQLAADTVFAVIDSTGRGVYHSKYPELAGERRDWSASPHVRAALGGRVGRVEGLRSASDGVVRMGATVPVPLVGWTVGVFRPREAALAPALSAVALKLVQLAALTVVVGVLAWFIAACFVRPLRALEAGAEALGAGRLATRVPDDAPDELGRLGRTFNVMAERLGRQMAALDAANARLRAVLESVPEGLVLVEASGRVVLANPAARAILGREPTADDLPVGRVLAGETFTEVEARVAVDGGERVLRVAGAPIVDETGNRTGAAVAFEDITARKALEQLKADFFARASHELRTPLTSALGTIRLLKRSLTGELPERPDALVAIASRNLGAMAALVNDLLDASKLEAGRETLALEVVDVASVVKAGLDAVAAQARDKSVALRATVPAGLTVPADPLKLERVLVNLLANAVKFMPAGGEVTVSAERDTAAVVLRVRDTGEGIAREHLEAIFEPFFQAGGRVARRIRGTGLGLAICRQIVRLHGGAIWAESEGPGRGSIFTVSLPAMRAGGRSASGG
jgi:signal transduction histidine kinase